MLRGMLGGSAVAVGLPALELFLNDSGTAYADCPGGLPTVFGTFYWGNGMIPADWNPTTTGAGYDLPTMLQPLAPIQSDVSIVSGMRVLTTNTSPHGSGPAGLFSGADLVDDTFVGPSLDQVIADGLVAAGASERRFHSVEIGIERSTSSWSMTGPHMVNPPECDPFSLYTRIFGPEFRLPGDMSMPDPRIALRQSVLDGVRDQSARLRTRVGTADRARLDQHLEGIRALETQLLALAMAPTAPACTARPTTPDMMYPDLDGRPQMQAIHRVMVDMLAVALACDQTRTFFEMFTQPVNNTLFLDATAGHHQLTHDEADPQPQVARIVTFIVGEFAYLVQKLASISEGSSRLLDRCAILGTTDVSYGRTHSLEDYPMMIAGNACGALRSGVHYRSLSGENASKIPLTLLNAVGVTATEYGRGAAHTTDTLGAILA
jgi:hypothetical protein